MENPPLISYLAMISSWFGGGEAWVKFWPCLFGAATVVVTCLIAAELGGKLFAQFIAGLSIITGAYLRMHFLFQPNMLDIFFWTLSIYFIIRYINDKEDKFIFWFVLSLALGFWGKYSILFIAISITAGIIAFPASKNISAKEILCCCANWIGNHTSQYMVAVSAQLAINSSYERVTGNAVEIYESIWFS